MQFLANCVQAGVNIATTIYNSTDTWQLVFAGISIILISRFILGPIMGFTVTGASDLASKRSKKRNDI